MIQTLVCLLFCFQIYEVGDIRIEGLKWADPDNIKARLALYKGDRVDREYIQNAVKRLSSSHQFKSVEMSSALTDSVIDITLQVTENPIMSEYFFDGNTHVKTNDLVDTLHLSVGEYVSDRKLFDWRKTIQRFYKGKGFIKADAEITMTPPDSVGGVQVLFWVKEGSKFQIQEIDIIGNTAFSDPTLEIKMKNREKNWWRKGQFREDLWPDDIAVLEEFYHDHGYPHATVDSVDFDYVEGAMFIKVFLDEGRRYKFGDVTFDGNSTFSTERLAPLATLEGSPGFFTRIRMLFNSKAFDRKIYSKKELEKAVMDIAGIYADSGFLYVGINPVESVREDSVVDVNFTVQEGHRVRVRLVEVEGNTKTKDHVIRRELDILPGYYFNRQLAIKSQRDLFFLNYFEDVGLDFTPTSDSGYIDLVFKVKEKPTGNVGMGVSYSGLEGMFGYLQYQQPNLFGSGKSASFTVEYGARRKNYQFGFTEPWLGGRPYLLGFDIHDYSSYRPEYDEHRLGGSVFFARPLWSDYWTIRLSYALERVYIFDVNPFYTSQLGLKKNPFLSSKVSATIRRDSRDRSFNASRGGRYSYTVDIVGGPFRAEHLSKIPGINAALLMLSLTEQKLGTAVNFQTHIVEGTQYFPHFNKFTLVARAKAGLTKGLYSFKDVPLYAKFWLGDIGPFGLRGYGFWSIGPGQLFTILTLEERFRLSEAAYLSAFIEAGDTWEGWGDVGYKSLKRGAGVGIRIEMPLLGIVGLDIAYGLDDRGGNWRTHIQFGSMY
jgi:outer membrane protein insertion porin family